MIRRSIPGMQIFLDIRLAQLSNPSVVAIGNFDGVHLGHQALLCLVRAQADAITARTGQSAHAGLITFDPHPLSVLRPDLPLLLLTTPTERMELAAQCGLDLGIVHPFTRETAALTATEFMALLREHLNMVCLVAGPDFALGKDRSGNLASLRGLGKEMGYEVVVMDPYDQGVRPVRSREVRTLLEEGAVAEAAALLGRPYSVTGVVVAGEKRGRQIGVPTANSQIPAHKLLPGDGVYATRTWIGGSDQTAPQPSVTNIGMRPTVGGLHRTVETHLLDFPTGTQSGNLYGQTLVVDFVQRLRGEQKFANLDDLVAQIQRDIVQGRVVLGSSPFTHPSFSQAVTGNEQKK